MNYLDRPQDYLETGLIDTKLEDDDFIRVSMTIKFHFL